VSSCDSTDRERAKRAAPASQVRRKVPARDGVAILGCGMCCRAANVNDANRDEEAARTAAMSKEHSDGR
jgi:hypothetical protein